MRMRSRRAQGCLEGRTLTASHSLSHHHHHSRGFVAASAESDNGADVSRHYDFDLLTIGVGSGGV
ncbi:hypothetical protein FNV43_RR00470 [Rhamnella rubrinervis]|uniref:Uncharacterized protein n=1 Tax=Rhamnella rubrinervis TaxID=2594499 RepID=A0A8K0MS18_9ROSA|nr:hypothetical protein FNV43_RR00470 [Rhamnella rubrinervis]